MSARISIEGIRRLGSRALMTFAACAAAAALAAPSAQADFGFSEFGTSLTADGQFSRQAGAHPDFTTVIKWSGNESIRDIEVDLPPGLVGNATVTDHCTAEELQGVDNNPRCPRTSQVGVAYVDAVPNDPAPRKLAVYNMVPPPDLPALFAFNEQGVLVRFEPRLRPDDDYGITTGVSQISSARSLAGSTVTFWGVPAEQSHHRMGYVAEIEDPFFEIPDPAPRLPLLTSPTSCPSTAATFSARIASWQDIGHFYEASDDKDSDEVPYNFDGCEKLAFDPSISSDPGSHRAGGPTGLTVDLKVPQDERADGLATAHVRNTVIQFPEGVRVSPSVAQGMAGCSPGQISLGTNDEPTCPASSRIGTVTVDTPLLDDPLQGEVIVASQNDNPFGSLLALYLVVRGPGVLIKLPGRVDLDPATGRITTTFDDNPQLPFSRLRVELKGGPKAPLIAPSACGTYETHAEITSWASSTPVEVSAPMAITEGCDAGGFSPTLHAGTTNPVAGSFSPFDLQVLRADGEQNLSRIQATLPEGLLAKLAGVPLCGEAQAASGDCPAASRVGSTTAAIGAGTSPLYVPEAGKAPTAVYLAGPYKGAPYSLLVDVPAQAGPFDFGTVLIRNALNVDPITAQATATSDPLPQILQGVPLSYRDVRVEIDRPEFTVNPTSCEEMRVTSTLTSTTGATASPSNRFQVAGCGDLGFKPSLKVSLKGSMRRTGNPALTAVLKAPAGQANIAKTAVVLPKSMFIDNAHINNPCTRVQFNEGACPKGSILGKATAYTPLLDQPLTGPVYFRSNGGERELPDMVADLGGQIHVTLVGFIDSKKGGVRTRFQNVPDAPVSTFVLKLAGGKRGLLENSTNLCNSTQRATVKMDGQNGKSHDFNPVLANSCSKKAATRHPRR